MTERDPFGIALHVCIRPSRNGSTGAIDYRDSQAYVDYVDSQEVTMTRRRKPITRAELELLKQVGQGPVSVRELTQRVEEVSGHARTTVLTMVERLRRKGYLTRKKINGVNRYSPRFSWQEVLRNTVSDFIQGFLGGSASPFLAYLAESPGLTDAEADKLRQVLRTVEDRERETKE